MKSVKGSVCALNYFDRKGLSTSTNGEALPSIPTKRIDSAERKVQDRLSLKSPPPTTDQKVQRIVRKNSVTKEDPGSERKLPNLSALSDSLYSPTKIKFKSSPTATTTVLEPLDSELSPATSPNRGTKTIGSGEQQFVVDEISAFEKALKNFDSSEVEGKLDDILTGSSNGKDYLSRIRDRKQIEVIARQEREKRRRKALVEQQQAQKQMEDKRREEMILEKLAKQSQDERNLASKLLQIREEKEKIRQNRILREQHYAERRQKQFEEALEKDAEWARKHRAEYYLQVQAEKEAYKRLEEQRTKQKYEKRYLKCQQAVRDIIDLSLRYYEYKILTDDEPPAKEFREWKALFVEGKPIFQNKTEQYSSEDELLNDVEFKDYIAGAGEWGVYSAAPVVEDTNDDHKMVTFSLPAHIPPPPPPPPAPKFPLNANHNPFLSKILDELDLVLNPPPPPEEPKVPDFPIRACIAGSLFSGKSTQCRLLAKKYKVTIITLDELLVPGTKVKYPIDTPEFRTHFENAQKALRDGKAVDDQTIVGLIVEKIKAIEGGTYKKDAPILNPNSNIGWVVDGFPRTLVQAQLFEKALTGYETPAKTKRTPARTREKQRSKLVLNAKETSQPTITPTKSGVDMFIRLDVDLETTIRRSVGRRLDPETGVVYHVEFNPPPVDQQMISSRLVALADPDTKESQSIEHQVMAYSDQKKFVEDWLANFGNLKALAGNRTPDEINKDIVKMFDQKLEEKTAEAEKKKQQQLAELEKKKKQLEAEEEERKKKELAKKQAEEQALLLQQAQMQAAQKSRDTSTPTAGGAKKVRRRPTTSTKPKDDAPSPTLPDIVEPDAESTSITEPLTPTPVEIEAPLQEPAPPKPVNYITPELSQLLLDKWQKLENHFVTASKQSFYIIRAERRSTVEHFAQIRRDYLEFLNRPDHFQEKVDNLVKACNDIDPDMRDDAETKQEIHQRAEDLKEALWEISDVRREEADEERRKIMKDGWIEDQITIILNSYITLMQIEVDRYFESRQLINDYYRVNRGEPLDTSVKIVDLPFIGSSLKFKPPSIIPDKKKKKPPTSSSSLKIKKDDPFPELTQTFEKALSLIPQDMYPMSNEALSQSNSWEGAPGGAVNEEVQALQVEDELLRSRIDAIKHRGFAVLTELRLQSERLYTKLDEWLGSRFKLEVTNIEKVVELIKAVAESESRFPQIFIQSSEVCVVDEEEEKKEDRKPKENERKIMGGADNRLSPSQLRDLTQKLQLVAPTGFILASELSEMLYIASGASKEYGTDDVPTDWTMLDRSHFVQLGLSYVVKIEKDQSFVNWKRFLFQHSLPMFPNSEQLSNLKKKYNSENDKMDLHTFVNTPLWYENNPLEDYSPLKEPLYALFQSEKDGQKVFALSDLIAALEPPNINSK